MKNIFSLILFISAFNTNVFAQNPLVKQWDKRLGGTSNDELHSLQQTTDGGYILGGHSQSGMSGDKTQPSWGNSFDYWIVKIDSLGLKQWDKRFGGTDDDLLTSLQQTSDGGYILGGYSESGISGDKTQPSWGGYDYWILKIDSLGVKQWDKRFGGTDADELYSLKQTTDGGFILGGFSASGISGNKSQPSWGYEDYWIVKINQFGIKQWDKRFGGTFLDYLYSLQQTTDGGYILGGYTYSNVNGDKTQTSWGSSDYWIVKIDSLGIKQWDKRFGGIVWERLFSLQKTSDGGYILAGFSGSGISGDKTQPSWGKYDYWIVKIDSVGNKQWDKRFGGTDDDEGTGYISQTMDGGFLLSGDSYSPISGDKTESNLGFEQTWVVKTDSLGNKQWDKTVFTTGHDEQGLAIQTKDGCYIMANMTGSGIGGDKTQASQGGSDYWITKFCDSTSAIVPISNLSASDSLFCEKQCINFTDISQNNPTSWQWTFNGALPSTSTDQNPMNICYNVYGTYDVTLVACNQFGCDTITKNNFITSYITPFDSIWFANDTLFALPAYSYQWYAVGAGLIANATQNYYVPLTLGSYYCTTKDSDGCEATSNVILYTSFFENENNELANAVWPNPANEILFVNPQLLNAKNIIFEIYDMQGRIILQQMLSNNINSINISQLATSVYSYRIMTIEKIIAQGKFVKQIKN